MKQEVRNVEDLIKQQYKEENIKIFTLYNREKKFVILAQKGKNNSYRYFEVCTKENVELIPIPDIFLYLETKNIDLNLNDNFIRMRNK